MKLELKPYAWTDSRGHHSAKFFPFVDGQPRFDISCEQCVKFRGHDTPCQQVQEHGSDGRCYPFCGPVCGYFEPEADSLQPV